MKKRERNSRMRRATGLLALWLCVVMGMSMTLLSYAEAAQGGSDIEGAESQTGLSEEVFLTGEEGNSADEANAAGLDEEADEMAAINEEDESEDPTDTELDGSAEDTGEAELDGSAEGAGEAEIDGSAEGAGEAEGVAEDAFDATEEDPDGNQDEEAMTDSSEAAGAEDVEANSDVGESGDAAEGDNDLAEAGNAEEAANQNPLETGDDAVGADDPVKSDNDEDADVDGEFDTEDHDDGSDEFDTEDYVGGTDGIDEAAGEDALEEESESGSGAEENAGASEEEAFPETEDAIDSAEDGDENGEDPGLPEGSEAEGADGMSVEEGTDGEDAEYFADEDSSGNDEAGLLSEEVGVLDAEVPAEEVTDGTDVSVEENADGTGISAEEAADGTGISAEEVTDGTDASTEEAGNGTEASAEENADGTDVFAEETAAEGSDESGELLSEEAEGQDPSETSEAVEAVLEGEGQKSAGSAEKGADGRQTDPNVIISYEEYLKNKAEKDSAGLMEEEEAAELMATQSKVAYIDLGSFWKVSRYLTGHYYQSDSSNYNLKIGGVYYNIDINCSVPEVTSFQREKSENNALVSYDVSTSDSEYYIWLNYSNGALQWYSGADVIKFASGNMSFMFDGFTGLQRVDFGGIDASEVTNMKAMFQDCASLLSFDLTGFDTRKVKSMQNMFYGCSGIRAIDLSMLETRELENTKGMFQNCSKLNAVKLSGQFTTARVTDMSFMFYGCSSLESMDLSAFDTRSCTTMQSMFYRCENLASLTLGGKFITSNVEEMVSMFEGCKSLAALNLGTFNTAKVKDMSSMFSNCESLTSLDLSGFDTSHVTDMPKMFYECHQLQTLTLGDNFNTEHCVVMTDMFSYCESLRTIYAGDGFVNTAQELEEDYIFTDCKSLVGGNGTRFDDFCTNSSYAHIDTAGNPGYFTRYWAVRVSNVTLSSNAVSVEKGATLQLTASVSPSNATEKGISWSSDNVTIANVTSGGKVTGVSLGRAVITVITTDGKKTATCTVTVTESINSDTISLAQKSFTYDGTGKTPAVTLVHNGKTLVQGQDYNVSYSSNVNAGTAVATVTGIGYYTGTRTVKFKITKAAQKLTITAPKKNAALSVGTKQDITVSGAQGKLSFKSSASAVAAVTTKGVLKAKKVGKATITITAKATANYKAASVKLPIKVTPAKTSSLTLTMQASGVKLSWKKVAGATGYYVYRNGKKAATIKKSSTVSYVDKKAKSNGAKYQYQIYAYASTGKGAASAKKTIYFLTVPKITGARNSRGGNIDIGWKQNQKATGYQVKYVVDGIEKTKTIKKAATVSATLGNLDIGDTYKISVRAYKTVGSTNYYSPWSAVKKVKVVK